MVLASASPSAYPHDRHADKNPASRRTGAAFDDDQLDGLGPVAGVSITMTVLFVVLLSFGIRLVSSPTYASGGQSGSASQALGYALLGLAAVLVLFGLYLSCRRFH